MKIEKLINTLTGIIARLRKFMLSTETLEEAKVLASLQKPTWYERNEPWADARWVQIMLGQRPLEASENLDKAAVALRDADTPQDLLMVWEHLYRATGALGHMVGGNLGSRWDIVRGTPTWRPIDVDNAVEVMNYELKEREQEYGREDDENYPSWPMSPEWEDKFRAVWDLIKFTDVDMLDAWAAEVVAIEKSKLKPGEWKKIDLGYAMSQETRECGGNYHSDEMLPQRLVEPLRRAGAAVSTSSFSGGGKVYVVVDGHLVKEYTSCCCQWWDDSHNDFVLLAGEGVNLVEGGWSEHDSDDEKRSETLKYIGAYKDFAAEKAREDAEEAKARRERYEAARDRAELLYPYVGLKVFKAKIRWALEDGVADAAKALAPHAKALAKHLRPCGGWPCHYKRIERAFHDAYGWGHESELEALMSACSLSQPRLDSAWRIAQILAS